MAPGPLRALAGATLLAGAGCNSQGVDPPAEITYMARLSGADVRPAPVATAATGTGVISIADGSVTMRFNITVTPMTDVTAAHLHVGGPEEVGALVVDLLPVPPHLGAFFGLLTSGTIRASNLLGGETIESLTTKIRNGNAYIDVHTVANPDGAIRGQVLVL